MFGPQGVLPFSEVLIETSWMLSFLATPQHWVSGYFPFGFWGPHTGGALRGSYSSESSSSGETSQLLCARTRVSFHSYSPSIGEGLEAELREGCFLMAHLMNSLQTSLSPLTFVLKA